MFDRFHGGGLEVLARSASSLQFTHALSLAYLLTLAVNCWERPSRREKSPKHQTFKSRNSTILLTSHPKELHRERKEERERGEIVQKAG
jgi:hypothetical protein